MPRFLDIQNLFGQSGSLAMVNETKGSYFIIDNVTGKFHMTFYTSGLFDLYPVKRDGEVRFCDDGGALTLVGIGRVESLEMSANVLVVGGGGPRMRFRIGEMPEPLRELHGIIPRGVAGSR